MNQPIDSSKTSPSLNSPLIAPAASASGIRPRDAIDIANNGSNNARLRFNRNTPKYCDIRSSRTGRKLDYCIFLYSAKFRHWQLDFWKKKFPLWKKSFHYGKKVVLG